MSKTKSQKSFDSRGRVCHHHVSTLKYVPPFLWISYIYTVISLLCVYEKKNV